jgi:hypothetical protein
MQLRSRPFIIVANKPPRRTINPENTRIVGFNYLFAELVKRSGIRLRNVAEECADGVAHIWSLQSSIFPRGAVESGTFELGGQSYDDCGRIPARVRFK